MQAITETKPAPAAQPMGPGDLAFAEMTVLYGNKFAQQWAGLTPREIKAAWNQKLAGFTPAEIRRGLDACMSHDWPPTLPEFIRMCRPTVSPEAAYHEAVAGMTARSQGKRGVWSHPAVYWAAVRVTSHDLLSIGWQAIRPRWEAAFRDVMSKGKWDPVPEPVKALPSPGGARLTKEQSKGFLEQVRKITGVSSLSAGGETQDHKAWVKRILEHPEGKSDTVLRMARNALQSQEG